jgi:hypothetical protein
MPTDKLITALGKAVAARWGELPVGAQQTLFEAAIESAGEGSREKLAIYLPWPASPDIAERQAG